MRLMQERILKAVDVGRVRVEDSSRIVDEGMLIPDNNILGGHSLWLDTVYHLHWLHPEQSPAFIDQVRAIPSLHPLEQILTSEFIGSSVRWHDAASGNPPCRLACRTLCEYTALSPLPPPIYSED